MFTSLTVYDISKPEILDMVESTQHSQKQGWIKHSDVDVGGDVIEKTATSDNDEPLDVYDNAGGEKIFQVPSDEEVIIINQKKVKSSIWYKVKTRGTEGLIEKLHNKMAVVIEDKSDELGLTADNLEQIQKMFKHPVYWPPVNKETGEQKNPSSFVKFVYYAKDDQFAELCTVDPETKEIHDLTMDDVKDSKFTADPVMNYGRVLVNPTKINPQNKIVSAVIKSNEVRERQRIQHELLSNIEINPDDFRGIMDAVKKSREEAAKASPQREESSVPNEGGEDIDDILGGGAVSETVELAGGKGDDEFPEVEGLDDI